MVQSAAELLAIVIKIRMITCKIT
uniref:Uncharacterized protein n=1 Tax=Anguilla anguilla TaxID=7936 RepID=A0A0E9S6Z4_ANGAN